MLRRFLRYADKVYQLDRLVCRVSDTSATFSSVVLMMLTRLGKAWLAERNSGVMAVLFLVFAAKLIAQGITG